MKLKYKDLIDKLGVVAEESKLLLRVRDDMVYIDGVSFDDSTINRIQRLLQLYGECQWWILTSDTMSPGIMYQIKIYTYL
jgi:hypothetical protein